MVDVALLCLAGEGPASAAAARLPEVEPASLIEDRAEPATEPGVLPLANGAGGAWPVECGDCAASLAGVEGPRAGERREVCFLLGEPGTGEPGPRPL